MLFIWRPLGKMLGVEEHSSNWDREHISPSHKGKLLRLSCLGEVFGSSMLLANLHGVWI